MKKLLIALFGGKKANDPAHKFTAYAIFGTSAILALAILVLAVSSIAFAIADSKQPAPPTVEGGGGGDGSGGLGSSALGLVASTYNENQLYSGDLIVLNDTNPLNPNSNNKNDLVKLTDNRQQKPEGETGFRFYYSVNTNSSATTATQNALDTMMMDYYVANNNDDNLIVNKAYGSGGIYDSGLVIELLYLNGSQRSDISSETHVWIYTHAHEYGFVNVPSVGANVFRYVGKAHATYMKEKSIATVEEYVELLKTKNSSAPLSLGNKVYAFYVANTATAAVSSKYAYTVSGNNIDGYIVTVDTNTPLSAATN